MGKKYELVAESMRSLGLRTAEEWQALADVVDWAHAYNVGSREPTAEELARAAGMTVDAAMAILARGQELGRAWGRS